MKKIIFTSISIILSILLVQLVLKCRIHRKPDVVKIVDPYEVKIFLDLDFKLSVQKNEKFFTINSIEILNIHSKLTTRFDLKKHNLHFSSIDFDAIKNNNDQIRIMNLSGSAENSNIFFENTFITKPCLHIDVINDFDPIRIVSEWRSE